MDADLRTGQRGPGGVADSADRLAIWLRRLRWPVVVAWLIVFVALQPLATGLSHVINDTAAAYLPPTAQSTRVAELEEAAVPARAGTAETDPALVIVARNGSLRESDRPRLAAARAAVTRLAGTHGIKTPSAPVASDDGAAMLFTVDISSTTATASTVDKAAVTALRARLRSALSGSGLRVHVAGVAGISADSGGSSSSDHLLLTAVLIVVVILLVVYRSPILWLLPLLGADAAITLTEASVHGLANAGLTVSSLSQSIMTVLIFGAATDYALLLVHRYRDELRRHERPEAAMASTLRRIVPTVLASAATVAVAMLCLLVSDSASLHGLGPVGAVSIAAALLAQTTLLPALLLIVGRPAFWPRIPRAGAVSHEESRLWSRIGDRVSVRPVLATILMALVLVALGAGLASLRTDNDPISNIPGSPDSVVGQRAIEAHFTPGALAPLTVLAPHDQATAASVVLHTTRDVASIAAGTAVAHDASFSAVLTVPPYGSQAEAALHDLRVRLAAHAPGALVGGAPAVVADGARTANHDDATIIPLVLIVILLIIALLLRAVIAPLLLVATTALSFAASFGLASVVWRYILGFSGMQSVLPLYIFIFLVALGVDYNIFLSDRVREEVRATDHRTGTLRGLGVTGGVITAAGIVLAGTFAALAQIPQVQLIEVGTAVALGVLLDTLLVRTVLVPALFLSFGARVWWPSRTASR